MTEASPERRWQYVFFDLDGTITASHTGIIRSVQYALRRMGRPVPEAAALMPLIGPPLQESFGRLLGGDPALAQEATRLYREYYTVTGIFENRVYDGVEDLLQALRHAGRTLCLATSKPEPFARRILTHFGLDACFSHVAGAELDGRRTGKTEVLRHAAALCGMDDPAAGLMVGDRKYDVAGAHSVGLACAGVLYGYGSREELQEAGADWLCPDPACLQKLVLGR
jgi:phosphoglycolate phosphatase